MHFGCEVPAGMTFVEFTAQSKMSGVNMADGTIVRKGASSAVQAMVKEMGGTIPEDLERS